MFATGRASLDETPTVVASRRTRLLLDVALTRTGRCFLHEWATDPSPSGFPTSRELPAVSNFDRLRGPDAGRIDL
jgi:hypothetical protein